MPLIIESQYAKFYVNQSIPEVIVTGTATGLVAGCMIKAVLTYGTVRTLPNTPLAFTLLHGTGATGYSSFTADVQFHSFTEEVVDPSLASKTNLEGIVNESVETLVGAQIAVTITNNGTETPLPVLTDTTGS